MNESDDDLPMEEATEETRARGVLESTLVTTGDEGSTICNDSDGDRLSLKATNEMSMLQMELVQTQLQSGCTISVLSSVILLSHCLSPLAVPHKHSKSIRESQKPMPLIRLNEYCKAIVYS